MTSISRIKSEAATAQIGYLSDRVEELTKVIFSLTSQMGKNQENHPNQVEKKGASADSGINSLLSTINYKVSKMNQLHGFDDFPAPPLDFLRDVDTFTDHSAGCSEHPSTITLPPPPPVPKFEKNAAPIKEPPPIKIAPKNLNPPNLNLISTAELLKKKNNLRKIDENERKMSFKTELDMTLKNRLAKQRKFIDSSGEENDDSFYV